MTLSNNSCMSFSRIVRRFRCHSTTRNTITSAFKQGTANAWLIFKCWVGWLVGRSVILMHSFFTSCFMDMDFHLNLSKPTWCCHNYYFFNCFHFISNIYFCLYFKFGSSTYFHLHKEGFCYLYHIPPHKLCLCSLLCLPPNQAHKHLPGIPKSFRPAADVAVDDDVYDRVSIVAVIIIALLCWAFYFFVFLFNLNSTWFSEVWTQKAGHNLYC